MSLQVHAAAHRASSDAQSLRCDMLLQPFVTYRCRWLDAAVPDNEKDKPIMAPGTSGVIYRPCPKRISHFTPSQDTLITRRAWPLQPRRCYTNDFACLRLCVSSGSHVVVVFKVSPGLTKSNICGSTSRHPTDAIAPATCSRCLGDRRAYLSTRLLQ